MIDCVCLSGEDRQVAGLSPVPTTKGQNQHGFEACVLYLPPEVASIQQLYHQMVRWATAEGCPHQSTQTAYEYQARLVNLLPEFGEEFSLITGQFVSARYGGLVPGKDELSRLRQSWQKIRHIRWESPA